MKHRRTHRHHSKRKTSRHTHRRRTHRRRGGLMNTSRCPDHIENRLRNLRDHLSQQTAGTIEDFYGDVRSLYDEAKDEGASHGCLGKIEAFENGPVKRKMDQLLGH
jgi:hypothetical protein